SMAAQATVSMAAQAASGAWMRLCGGFAGAGSVAALLRFVNSIVGCLTPFASSHPLRSPSSLPRGSMTPREALAVEVEGDGAVMTQQDEKRSLRPEGSQPAPKEEEVSPSSVLNAVCEEAEPMEVRPQTAALPKPGGAGDVNAVGKVIGDATGSSGVKPHNSDAEDSAAGGSQPDTPLEASADEKHIQGSTSPGQPALSSQQPGGKATPAPNAEGSTASPPPCAGTTAGTPAVDQWGFSAPSPTRHEPFISSYSYANGRPPAPDAGADAGQDTSHSHVKHSPDAPNRGADAGRDTSYSYVKPSAAAASESNTGRDTSYSYVKPSAASASESNTGRDTSYSYVKPSTSSTSSSSYSGANPSSRRESVRPAGAGGAEGAERGAAANNKAHRSSSGASKSSSYSYTNPPYRGAGAGPGKMGQKTGSNNQKTGSANNQRSQSAGRQRPTTEGDMSWPRSESSFTSRQRASSTGRERPSSTRASSKPAGSAPQRAGMFSTKPGKPAAAPPTARERLKAQVALELQKTADGKNLSGLLRELGVPLPGGPQPPVSEIKKAYKRAALKFHPDRHVQSDLRVQVHAEEAWSLISAKYTAMFG
ncbi:hypothetical protein CYMTET_50244, partial [Cymbomonas tetramitiformis]